MARKTKVEVTYSCGHAREFGEQYPYKGDCVLCPVCDQTVTVLASRKVTYTKSEAYVSPWEEEVVLMR